MWKRLRRFFSPEYEYRHVRIWCRVGVEGGEKGDNNGDHVAGLLREGWRPYLALPVTVESMPNRTATLIVSEAFMRRRKS